MIGIRFGGLLDQSRSDLGHLERMRQAGAVEVTVAQVQDLGLALKPAKRCGMDDTRVVDVARIACIFPLRTPGLAPLQPVFAHHKTLQSDVSFQAASMHEKTPAHKEPVQGAGYESR